MEIIITLIADGANHNLMTNDGQTASELARAAGHAPVVEYLESLNTVKESAGR